MNQLGIHMQITQKQRLLFLNEESMRSEQYFEALQREEMRVGLTALRKCRIMYAYPLR